MPKPASPFPPKTDFFSKHGAGLLADAVMAYWVRKGVGHVVAERYAMGNTGAWGVRSNLVNGLPSPKRSKGRPVGSGTGPTGPQENPRAPIRRVLTPRSEPEVAAALEAKRREFLR